MSPYIWQQLTNQSNMCGVDINPWRGVVLQTQVPYLKTLIKRIDIPRLKPTQKVDILRYYALPKVTYVCVNSDANLKELTQLDKHVRQAVKKWLHLHHYVTDGLIYSRYRDGGINIPKMAILIPAAWIRGLLKLITFEDEVTAAVAQTAGIERKIRKFIKLVTTKEAPRNLADFNPSTVYSKTLKGLEFEKWSRQTVQGKGVIHFGNDSVSNHWLSDPT